MTFTHAADPRNTMNRTKTFGKALAVAAAAVILASCGGGGSDDSANAPTSYWTMDSYTYVDGGISSQSTAAIAGKSVTVVAVSTSTLNGGDKSNGAYSGGALTFSFLGTSGGTYNIVPSWPPSSVQSRRRTRSSSRAT